MYDRVEPGFYGEQPDAQAPAPPAGPPTAAATAAPVAGAPAPVPQNAAGAANAAGTDDADATRMDGVLDVSESAPAPVSAPAAGDPCDLSGRWLATLHYVTDALGQQQTTHTWLYYEIARTEAGFEITRGLHCGQEAMGTGDLAVQVSFESSRAAGIDRISYAGQPVSSTPSAAGCAVRFDRWYVVQGATTPHYADPAIALPSFELPASGGAPGWEDWDGDGQPGISATVTGAITGKLFMAPRVWIALSGTVADTRSRMRLAVDWNQETNLLGIDGSPLLLTQGVRAASPALHFAELVRLADDQATGDAHATCQELVELAPALTPDASAI